MTSRTYNLAQWAANLSYDDIPQDVVERTKELFLDTLACAIAGRDHPAVSAIRDFAKIMGSSTGTAEFIDSTLGSNSPAFAALVNGASSHVVEQDDLHNSSIVHPATIIFPTALAVAQDVGADGKEFITACVVGYEASCRAGEFLGKSHYANFHMTATAGVIGVAAAAARLLKLDTETTLSAIGTAGTQAAGLWQFLLDATHSKQVHTAKACFDGIFAAYTAKAGLLGPADILEGQRGMGAVLVPGSTLPTAIDSDLGKKFSIMGSSFKWHASCRHTHPSVDGLLLIMQKHGLTMGDIESVTCRTYQAAINVLSLSGACTTVHQSKFSMGFVLAVAAKNGRASILDFTEEVLHDAEIKEFQARVQMVFDENIESRFPVDWQGIVEVVTKSGQTHSEFVEVVKGDPANTLSRAELEQKVAILTKYGGVQDETGVASLVKRAWNLENEASMLGFKFT